eukprot:CAMPEP_0194541172 /NCGR_PEP_ID=MMETSP0253-20130528/81764_1 /TAXON_ID=2966 /ORGANISM="Noctiluca scintillans" /LENGTH=112 /DNA_ID=CAMNT_0039387635 /DNA_START=84 /DNA_END=422 /DNA_ORIENTATION=+
MRVCASLFQKNPMTWSIVHLFCGTVWWLQCNSQFTSECRCVLVVLAMIVVNMFILPSSSSTPSFITWSCFEAEGRKYMAELDLATDVDESGRAQRFKRAGVLRRIAIAFDRW